MKKHFIRLERNKIILTIIDILIVAITCFFSKFILSTDFYYTSTDLVTIGNSVILYIIIYQIYFRVFDVYRNITRYENGKDYLIYIFTCILSCITIFLVKHTLTLNLLTTKECILTAIMIAVMCVSYRVIIRIILLNEYTNKNQSKIMIKRKNLLIIGAGSAAREIIKAIKDTMKDTYTIIGIIDDNPRKWSYSISGVKILGDRKKIIEVCEKYEVEEIFFTISKIKSQNKKEILEICQNVNAKLRMLPSTRDLIENKSLIENLKDVEIEDLLGRDPVKLDNNNIENLIEDNVILVTGGGGSIGSELCRQIAKFNPKTLVILDIYENNLYNIQMELKSQYPELDLQAIVGSVKDNNKLEKVFETYKPYLVFHAAAHKHVPLMEISPLEAIKNNVFGTYNMVNCADKYNAKRFILISTDKAVNPTNVMGATKRMCEIIVQYKNRKSNTEFVAVRFGNVLGSNGSVVPLFKKQIKEGGPVTVTHKEITRFFMTITEAVELVLQAMTYAKGGEIFVLDMGKPVKIYDLAISLIKLSGLEPDIDIPIEITGLRPGEKLYEELLMGEEGLEKTAHSKIFVAEPLNIPEVEVKKRLNILQELIKSEDHTMEEIKEKVKMAVPTFSEPEEQNNIVKDYKKEIEDKTITKKVKILNENIFIGSNLKEA